MDLARATRTPLAVALISSAAFALVASVAGCDGPPSAANPLAGIEQVDQRLTGDVAEVVAAGSYTYFVVTTPDAPTWAVVMGQGPAVGDRIDARVFARRTDFRSRRLDRTFDEVAFVSLN